MTCIHPRLRMCCRELLRACHDLEEARAEDQLFSLHIGTWEICMLGALSGRSWSPELPPRQVEILAFIELYFTSYAHRTCNRILVLCSFELPARASGRPGVYISFKTSRQQTVRRSSTMALSAITMGACDACRNQDPLCGQGPTFTHPSV